MSASNNKPDLYEIVGVHRTATEEEIKKAFRKKAVKLHPDRNPENTEEANRQFQELNRAAKILSNPDRRKRYDQFGVIDGDAEQPGAGGFNPFDLFGNIFGGGGGGGMPGFFNMGGGMPHQNNRNAKSPDKKLTINISLVDVYLGKQIPLDFIKVICCDQCQGLGAKSAEFVVSCNICNGQGRVVKMTQMGPMIQQVVQPCGACSGKGKMIKQGGECGNCHGKKGVGIKRHLDCYVRPGSQPGTIITFKNEADWHVDFADAGDLVLFVNSKNEEAGFYREGDNLIMKKNITLLEALTNFTMYFKHLDNRVIKVTNEEIIHPNQKMIIKGEGMPNLADNLVKGDLIIHFEVTFPQSLDKDRSKYLVKILPVPKKQIWDLQLEKTPDNEITTHTMSSFDDNQHNRNQSRQHNPDEQMHNMPNIPNMPNMHIDDDDFPNMGGGAHPIECATQ
jgi:DnaJ-class molecular chaperone